MPTYEYECEECGAITEVFQSITERPRRKLRESDRPRCDCGAGVTRLIGRGAGIIFKGSGFYQTDYRSDGYKKAAEAEKGGKKSDKGSDSKKGKDDKTTTSNTGDAQRAKSSDKSTKGSS